MRAFDLSPLLQSSIGFDDLLGLSNSLARAGGDKAYPPYNIEKTGEFEYQISMALAGFTEDELRVDIEDDMLTVSAEATREEEGSEREFLYQGIAKRAFQRQFRLADSIRVTDAKFENGLLNIHLVREVPEHKRPRQIEINGKINKRLEGKAA